MMRLNSRTTVPLLGAAMMAVAGCNCDNTEMVDAGGPIDANVPVDAFTPSPELTISPSVQEFGDVVVGEASTAATFTVTNEGTGRSPRLVAELGGADPGSYRISANNCGDALDPDQTCTVSVIFQPRSEGASSATLTVRGGDVEAAASLSGNGAADAGLVISPTPYNFGDAILGTPSAPQTFTVRNTGDAESGMITISLSGLDATQFELGTDACTGETLAADATCTVEVIYAPSASGVHMGTLQASASPGATATATIQGRAAAAASLRLLPTSQDFGTVVTGSSSPEVTFTLTNPGGVPTGTISHTFGGANAAEFSVRASTCAGAPLAGGANCEIVVRFNAASAGAKVATLDVTDGTLNASSSLTATGAAPGAIVIEPSTRDFGSSAIGVATGGTTFTVRNTGGSATGALTVALAGTNPADFPVIEGGDGCSGATLPAAGTCTIAVQFRPGASGARSATLRVQGTPGGTATAALSGNGESAAAIEVTPTAADFGSVATGSNSSNVAFTVRNTGGAASGIPSVALTGVQATQFNIVSNGCTASLPGGGTCTITARFSPTGTGARTARLEVSASPGGSDASDLSGNGITPAALTLMPTAASYGNVAETTSQTRMFTVQNTGAEASALTFSVTAGGPEFSIVTGAGTTCGATLAGGANCTIEVAFAPAQGSTTSAGTLTVTGTPGGTLTAALSATPIPDLLITPPATNAFTASNGGSGVIIGANVQNTYTITNQTGRALTALTVASPTGMMEFTRPSGAAGGTCGTTLAAGANCTVVLQFTPTGAPGARTASLTVTASGGATQTAAIAGTARGALRWTAWQVTGGPSNTFAIPPVAAAYGDRAVGGFYDMTLTLTNENTAATSSIATMAPSFTGDMNLQNDLCTGTNLAAGATCTVRVRFYPRTTGPATGALTITQGAATAVANITANGITGASITVAGTADFGTVIATRTQDRTFTITNTGAVATANLSYSLSGARYSIQSTTCPATGTMPLAAGASCTITARFAPSQADSTTSAFTGTLAAGQGAQTVNTAITGRVGSQLTLTPATASFVTPVGVTSSTSRFTVTNVGLNPSGSITVAAGSFSAEFPITNNTCATLAAGATCTFDVAFAPTANVDRTGVEIQASNGAYVPGVARVAVSTVSGDARQPAALSIVPSTGPFRYGVFFGFVARGTNSDPYTFTVRNSGDLPSGPLTASILPAFVGDTGCDTGGPGGVGGDYWDVLSTTCSGPLAAGGSCTVTIRSSPPSGSNICDVDNDWRITDGTSSATGRLSMSTLQPDTIFSTPTIVDFGSVIAGTAGPTRTFTVTNGSATARTITSAPINIGSFSIASSSCTVGLVLAPGDACTFTATYAPPLAGPFGLEQALLAVNTSGGLNAISSATGISLRPAGISVTPADTTPDFPSTVAGQTSRITYTVSNTGDVATAAAPAVTIGGADPSQFTVANNTCTAALAASGTGSASSCTFDVVFAPSGAGARSATLGINAGGAATSSRALSGTGIGAALLGISPSAPQTCADRAAGTGLLDFGVCTTYTVTNGGGSASLPLSLSVTGDFRIQDNSTCVGGSGTGLGLSSIPAGSALAAGSTCTVIVQHAPQTVGADSGTLTVGASGIASVTGTISSNGISAFQHTNTSPGAYTAGTVAFGSVAVGAAVGGNQIISFVNQTDPATRVMTYTITGANAADFDMQSDTCSGGTFGRGAGCATTIRFLPSATGARTATLTITDGSAERTAVVTLTGTGT
jgi:hypothetical protein